MRGLLEMLRAGTDKKWSEEDPRWYRDVHAGLLLIEFQEEEALPIFYGIYSGEEREEVLGDWFQQQLPKDGSEIGGGFYESDDVWERIGELIPDRDDIPTIKYEAHPDTHIRKLASDETWRMAKRVFKD